LTEGSRTRGGLPLSYKAFLTSSSAFFFDTIGAKKKAWQKRNANNVSPSAEGDQRCARWIGGRFLKKATQKLSSKQTDKSKFEIILLKNKVKT